MLRFEKLTQLPLCKGLWLSLAYADTNHVHAVTGAGSNTYSYDANGNQTIRVIGADTYNLKYDAENRLVEVKKNNNVIATFVFDGDGKRVKSVINGTTTLFVGAGYEVKNPGTGQEITKYYFAGASRVAMRKYVMPQSPTVNYMLYDHLGSTNITTDANGAVVSGLRYKAWGEVRYPTNGLNPGPSKYTYTGQYSNVDDFGLMSYNARWYDQVTGRFTQPDTIIPQNQGVQAWDRYAYVSNNPVRYTDPTGHCISCFIVSAAFTVANLAMVYVPTALGARPDYEGIVATMVLTDTNDAVVAAGLAVQSEYPWAIFTGNGTGLAQATEDELHGQNPDSPSVAEEVMDARISDAVAACKKCDGPTDKLIVAALAQNGAGFDEGDVKDLPVQNGQINWMEVMNNGGNPSAFDAQMRQNFTGMQYETRLMLKIFMQDLDVFMQNGYQLPDEYVGADFNKINNLIYPQDGRRGNHR